MDEPKESLRLTYRDAFLAITIFFVFLQVIVIVQSRMWEWALTDQVVSWMIEFCELFQKHGLSNVWTPYPQGTNLVLYLLYWIASLGPLGNLLFWALYKSFIHVIPNVLTLYLIYLIGKELGSERLAFFASMFYAFSFAPHLYGLYTNFVYDPFPVFLTVLGLYLLLKRRITTSAIVIGFATVVKLFPVLIFPIALKFLKGEERKRFAVPYIAVIGLVLLPFVILNFPVFMSTYYWQNGRPPWETAYGYILAVSGAPFTYDQPYYQDYFNTNTGWLFWGITPNPATLTTPVPPQPTNWWNVISLVGFLVMFTQLIPATVESRDHVVKWSSYMFTSFFIWNIGWSPQYELFLIPLFLLSFGDRVKKAAVIVYLLQIVVTLEYLLSQFAVSGVVGAAPAKMLFGLLRYGIFAYVIYALYEYRLVFTEPRQTFRSLIAKLGFAFSRKS